MLQNRQNENKSLKSLRCPFCNGTLYYFPFAIGDLDPRRFLKTLTVFLCSSCGYGGAPERTDDEPSRPRPVNVPEELLPFAKRARVKFVYESGAKQEIEDSKNLADEILWWPVGVEWCDRMGRVRRSIDPAMRKRELVWETRTRARHAGRPRTVTYEKFADALAGAKVK